LALLSATASVLTWRARSPSVAASTACHAVQPAHRERR
jgi:hypothetical protein